MNNKIKGFTLIELLVVISIISMLSSVVLASLQGAREKARIAAALLFDGTNYHGFGADSLIHFDYEKGSGIPDPSSPYNVTIQTLDCDPTYGGDSTCNDGYKTDTPNGQGKSYQFHPDSSNFVMLYDPPIDLSNYTASIWVKPLSFDSSIYLDGYCLSILCPGGPGGGRVFKIYMYNAGSLATADLVLSVPINLPVDRWSLLTVSYRTESGKYQFYIDGRLVFTHNITPGTALPHNGFVSRIGLVGNNIASILVDNVSVYPYPLSGK